MRQERTRTTLLSLAAGAAAFTSLCFVQGPQVDSKLPKYEKASGVSGRLGSVGSDTLNNLMTFWTESFQKLYPSVRTEVEGKGSSTAPPALIKGTAQLGPMSRKMKSTEIDEFRARFGYEPTAIRVAIDALAVWVHADNPVERVTMQQIDAMFSKARRGGYAEDVSTWGQLGATGEWAKLPLSLYGRNSASGTYGYFKEHALFKGDFKDTVKEQPGSASVVQSVTTDRAAVGYSGIGYRTSGVKALAVANKEGDPFVSTDSENVYSGKYPLSRFLYVYVNKAPNQPIDPLVREFLRFVLSSEGQEIVLKDGYLPLTAKMAEQELERLGPVQ